MKFSTETEWQYLTPCDPLFLWSTIPLLNGNGWNILYIFLNIVGEREEWRGEGRVRQVRSREI